MISQIFVISQLFVSNCDVVCYSALPSLTYCYARVIRDTCNTSATDINVLKTLIYNLKFSRYLTTPCPLGELQITAQITTVFYTHWL